jgi:hypothetical protein
MVMIDVDQYLDMPSFLCDNFKPTLLYTFQPARVAYSGPEYSYTFDAENNATYNVSGGAVYKHQVWNYSVDNLMVCKTFCSIPYSVATYLVDRRHTKPDHEMVFLTPLNSWYGLFAPLAYLFLSGSMLLRLCPVVDSFLRLSICTKGGMQVSTGQVGNYIQITTTAEVDAAISTIARTSKYPLTLAQVTSYVEGDRIGSAVLHEFHLAKNNFKAPVVFPVNEGVRRYQFSPEDYDPAAKPSLVPFMNPFIHGAFAPDRTIGNEKRAVDGRVNETKPPILPMTPFLSECMDEFVAFLIPNPGTLVPAEVSVVFDKQDRPTQRRILDVADKFFTGLYARVVQSFTKAESYDNVKDPRIISTVNGVDKRDYSRFIYALVEEVLMKTDWYAFGMTPREISARVVDVCNAAIKATANTDFHRFDGHGSNNMRELERRALSRAFRPEYKERVLELHKTQYDLKAFTTLGIAYTTDFTRLSGSAETAALNTTVNAFVDYLATRISLPGKPGLTVQEAWKALGIYGGDDGHTPDPDVEKMMKAAAMMGHSLDIVPVSKGSFGVSFLARIYGPDVWTGDNNSCCDLPRQLSKFHVTTSLPSNVSPIDKLLEKSRSFLLTDSNTPLIGPYVRKVQEIYNRPIALNPLTSGMRAWNSDANPDVQYMNEGASWMEDYAFNVLPNVNARQHHDWIDRAHSLQCLLSPPLMQEPAQAKTSHPVVVDGELILPKTIISDAKPTKAVARPETPKIPFEEYKAKRMAEGKWEERPPKDKSGKVSKPPPDAPSDKKKADVPVTPPSVTTAPNETKTTFPAQTFTFDPSLLTEFKFV